MQLVEISTNFRGFQSSFTWLQPHLTLFYQILTSYCFTYSITQTCRYEYDVWTTNWYLMGLCGSLRSWHFPAETVSRSKVYSYGVVLLKLITRNTAVDTSFPHNMDILGWVPPRHEQHRPNQSRRTPSPHGLHHSRVWRKCAKSCPWLLDA
jgi:hypothetical protein